MEFILNRGPDLTSNINYNNFTFVHNLLHLTGDITPQPFVDKENNIVCLFNGEIYNYQDFGNYKSDGECLIPLYLNNGYDFVKKLDGEFAIVLFDFKKNIFQISSDIFATKPLWYSFDNNTIGISSYKSPLERLGFVNIKKITANMFYVYDITTLNLLKNDQLYIFDLNQYKNTYDDWITVFENAIIKRTNNLNYSLFVCMSSGYDSGAICCALNKINKPYKTYTITGNENMNIVNNRIKINNNENFVYTMLDNDINEIRSNIPSLIDNYTYTFTKNDTLKPIFRGININMTKKETLRDDPAIVGLYYLCNKARSENKRIFLSGMGVDELMSDYAINSTKIFGHSCFNGIFPDDLKTIFPNNSLDYNAKWFSFYSGAMESYLIKEEYISGSCGIEGRYPFLDKYVVQEFLNLSTKLKNYCYKSPIDFYLSKQNYPFEKNIKFGFDIKHDPAKIKKNKDRFKSKKN